jgi:hypothetical protein
MARGESDVWAMCCKKFLLSECIRGYNNKKSLYFLSKGIFIKNNKLII